MSKDIGQDDAERYLASQGRKRKRVRVNANDADLVEKAFHELDLESLKALRAKALLFLNDLEDHIEEREAKGEDKDPELV